MLKQFFFSILFFLCLGFFSCNHADQLPVEEMVLDFNESKLSNRGNFQILFKKVVGDSRCPLDAICGWPGLGEVTIELMSDDLTEEVTLNVNEMTKFFESTNFKDHEITLMELAPYPLYAAGVIEEEDYQIKLSIE